MTPRPSSPDGLVWIDPGRSGHLVSLTEPSLHVWKSDARSGDREKGLHTWAIATEEKMALSEEAPGTPGTWLILNTVTSPGHPVIKPLGDLRQISL